MVTRRSLAIILAVLVIAFLMNTNATKRVPKNQNVAEPEPATID